jgi:hypothetical protein
MKIAAQDPFYAPKDALGIMKAEKTSLPLLEDLDSNREQQEREMQL